MNVLVFGATGKTGSLVVDRIWEQGHEVSVLVRDSRKLKHMRANLITGDATNASDVTRAVQGHDAVIDTIGGTTPWKSTELERTAARNIIAAMHAKGARRLIVVTMMGLGDSREQAPFWYRNILMKTFLHGSTADKAAVEAEVMASGLDFTIVRPPILTETASIGEGKVIGPGEIGHKIARIDLAKFLVDQLTSDQYVGRAVTVVNS